MWWKKKKKKVVFFAVFQSSSRTAYVLDTIEDSENITEKFWLWVTAHLDRNNKEFGGKYTIINCNIIR